MKNGLSGKTYKRVRIKNRKYIISKTLHTQKDEFYNFLSIQRYLIKHKIPVPQVFNVDKERLTILQEDIGKISLEKFFKSEKNITLIRKVYKTIICILISMQRTRSNLPILKKRSFTHRNILKEYKNLIVPLLIDGHLKIKDLKNKRKIRNWYFKTTKDVDILKKVFCHRDFQSSNILLKNGRYPVIIDFQGARLASPVYDLVSLIECNYTQIPISLKVELKLYYFKRSSLKITFNKFINIYNATLIQRKLHDAAVFAKLFDDTKNKKYQKYLNRCLMIIRKHVGNNFLSSTRT